MVLVDTSVWIRFLANRMPYAAGLGRLLEGDEAAGHDLVYGELLIGGSRGRIRLLNSYDLMHRVPAVVMRTSLPSCGRTSCMAEALGGSMRICSLPPLSPARLSGQRTSIWPRWPANSESHSVLAAPDEMPSPSSQEELPCA